MTISLVKEAAEMSKISKNVKQLRQERGMTQDDLAGKLFVTRQAISSWENDRTQPDVHMLGKLREVFGVSIEELLYGKKRNTALELEKPDYTKTLITVFSVLGSILITAGLILIFVTGWEKMPDILKKGLAFLPLIIGQTAGTFVLIKKKDKKAWCEGGAVFWGIGIIASCFMVQGVFDVYVYDENYYLIMALALLPVVFLMKSVCALVAFYVTGFFQIYGFAEGVVYYPLGAVKYIFWGICALLIFAVGILLTRILEKTDRESHRISIVQWINAIAFPVFALFYVMLGRFDTGNAVLFVSAILLSYFIVGQKEKAITSPMRFLGLFGTAGCVCLSSYVNFFGFGYAGGAGQVALVTVQLIMILMALLIIKCRFASKLHLVMSGAYLVIHFLFLAVMFFDDLPNRAGSPEAMAALYDKCTRWEDITFVVMQIFAITFFSLLIAQGAIDKKLTVMNTGFIGFIHQIIFWVAGSGLGMLTNGIVLLSCGGVLLFVNLKIAKSKNQKTRTLSVNSGEEVEADEK